MDHGKIMWKPVVCLWIGIRSVLGTTDLKDISNQHINPYGRLNMHIRTHIDVHKLGPRKDINVK